MRRLAPIALCLLVAVELPGGTAAARDDGRYDVPYVPTPMATVTKMLDMAKVGPNDIVYDLGSGDGRIVVSAVRDYRARKAVGVDINPIRIDESEENARKAGVTARTKFVRADVFTFDFSEATVLTMYLLPEVNARLRPRILSLLKPGTRVVSHDFDMEEWEPDDIASMDGFRHVFLWVVPAQVGGIWEFSVGDARHRLVVEQSFQRLEGRVQAGDKLLLVRSGRVLGREIDFIGRATESGRDVTARYTGKVVADDAIEGIVEIDGRRRPFKGRRIAAAAR